MAYSDIDKPSDYFNTVLYTGNASTQSITGVGFQPDWVWVKDRTGANSHEVQDVVRGAGLGLLPNGTSAELTGRTLYQFDSDGFSLNGTNTTTNVNGDNYVAWNWLAGGTSSSNTDGSITSQVSANTTSGFSIVSWTGSGANATIGHGLGVAPKMIIFKNRDSAINWPVYHKSLGATKVVYLSLTDASITYNYYQNTDPTSSVFYVVNDGAVSGSGNDMIAYCFAEKKGFSKFGSYVGTGSGTGGVFNYLGFKPAMVIIKASSTTGEWLMYDNKRSPFNETRLTLSADNSDAEEEVGTRKINMVSNGFEIGSNSAYTNSSGQTYIYMAFAENPFVTSTGVPTTAR